MIMPVSKIQMIILFIEDTDLMLIMELRLT